jgi:outer membrane protein assembly factor BamB
VRPPLNWTAEENVRWRVDLPEAGNSTPITVHDRVFITQPITEENWRGVFFFDAKNGDLLWKNGLVYDQPERSHRTNPYCSASPSSDGKILVASFGSAGVAAYAVTDGKQLWHRDLGPIDHEWGNSSSPVLFEDWCIHYHGPGKGAFLIALSKKTGETIWRWDEPDWEPGVRTDGFQGQGRGVIGSFSTPILVEVGDRLELIMSFPQELKAFDLPTGKVLWSCGGLNPLVYTSPVEHNGIVVAMGGYHGNSIAVRTGGEGDVTASHRLWQKVRDNGGIGTGVMWGGYYFYHDSGGIVSCLDIDTGEIRWKERLPGASKSWGSLLLVGSGIYTLSQTGETVVFEANPERLNVMAQSSVGEQTNSSLVPSDDRLFIRTHQALWCIGPK